MLKPVIYAFSLDYSTDGEKIVIYELQKLVSGISQGSNASEIDRIKRFEYLRNAYYSGTINIIFDLPSNLDQDKARQRVFLHMYEDLLEYLPKHKIVWRTAMEIAIKTDCFIDKYLSIQDWMNLYSIYENFQHNCVVKTHLDFGNGNLFLRRKDGILNYSRFVQKLKDFLLYKDKFNHNATIINAYRANGLSFSIEEIKMYQHSNIDKYAKRTNNPGNFRRAFIFYNSETREADVYNIYKYILDMNDSTNNHDEHGVQHHILKLKNYVMNTGNSLFDQKVGRWRHVSLKRLARKLGVRLDNYIKKFPMRLSPQSFFHPPDAAEYFFDKSTMIRENSFCRIFWRNCHQEYQHAMDMFFKENSANFEPFDFRNLDDFYLTELDLKNAKIAFGDPTENLIPRFDLLL